MTPTSAARRFALVSFLTWLPTGLYIAPMVLLMLDRGLGVGTIAAITVAYSVTVAVLELPTGGLADVLGRRVVLTAAAIASLLGLLALGLAETVALFAVSSVLRGIARALGSGPAEAWFVDTVHASAGPDADLGHGLARGEAAGSAALAVGTIAGGVIPLLIGGGQALAVPVLIAAGVEVVRLIVTAVGLPEPRRARLTAASVLQGIPGTVAAGLRLALRDRVVGRMLAVTGMVGVALATIELLTPVWMATLTGSTEAAGFAYAVVAAAGFAASALGSYLSAPVGRRFGSPGRAAAAGITVSAVSLVLLAGSTWLSGLPGIVMAGLAYSLMFVGLGVSTPAQGQLVHARVAAGERATVLSVESLALQFAGAGGAMALGFLAGRTGPVAAFAVAAVCLGACVPLLRGLTHTADPQREPAAVPVLH
ncbi:MFS family permease [Allocatelliglobosispora scoriae]|uniref:MFS family permease n=1 Tax=Allocatelliglobosispora scoriae TaxID=643052 RepID=A0A841BWG6_9ACTN|nr:MFS transporter [Allocatelliglobosispora scoriae]MBB5871846.1 MFS family permease [Allocatelliglobosispora scoriae]